MKIGLIGHGAIAKYVAASVPKVGATLKFVIARSGREKAAQDTIGAGTSIVTSFQAADIIIDCAGHAGLRDHGPDILRAGIPLITLSIGALADTDLYDALSQAARDGNTQLHLSSGAIGGLDALASAKIGRLDTVTYTGRKPPIGWKGSPAEDMMDLANPGTDPTTHFDGNAGEAALLYPKNANVAAAVALAGLGFAQTKVRLIADPKISSNIHEITATGDFGSMHFTVAGNTLPENPRTSALAAMSMVKAIARSQKPITF